MNFEIDDDHQAIIDAVDRVCVQFRRFVLEFVRHRAPIPVGVLHGDGGGRLGAVGYAKEREVFDRPIGAQAIAHPLARVRGRPGDPDPGGLGYATEYQDRVSGGAIRA